MLKNLRSRLIRAIIGAGVALSAASAAHSLSIQDMVRLEGQGETKLWGLGLVTGLPGTGDSAKHLPMARQLAALLEKGGNPVPDLGELAAGQNMAMVMVTCTIPRQGAKRGDKFDCHVESVFSADSLEGGRLFITPLQGPLPGQGVYAFAEGPLSIEGTTVTSARVYAGPGSGSEVFTNIDMNVVSPRGTITLNIEPRYASWTTAKLLANTVSQHRDGLTATSTEIARALDEKSVVVEIPEPELASPANFIGEILSIQLDPSLLELPARVIVNEARGTIAITGDVQISPAAVAHRDLFITTVSPPPVPTPDAPLLERTNWTSLEAGGSERSQARLEDLITALKELNVSVTDQIAILKQLHRIGQLHAEFIVE